MSTNSCEAIRVHIYIVIGTTRDTSLVFANLKTLQKIETP